MDEEMGAGQGAPQVEEHAESTCPAPNLQVRNAKVARALRLRIYHLLRDRADKARHSLSLEKWYRAEQERLLDEIMIDGITLRRFEALAQQLEGAAS